MWALLSQYKLLAIAIATVVVLTAAFGFGYNAASNKCKADKLHELERQAEIIQRLENEVREKEKEALAAKQNREVEVREVIKKVPIYINRNDCSISSDGVSDINAVLRGTSPE